MAEATLARGRLLFVDDEPSIRATLPLILRSRGFDVTVAASVEEAIDTMRRQPFDILLSDLNISQPGDGFLVVRAIRELNPRCLVIILTGYPALETAVSRSSLALVRLVAPTTPDARLPAALQGAGGFVYLISRLGVTGARADTPPELESQVARVRRATSLPVAVGFGISTPEHVRAAARVADGVVVGSALVAEIERGGAEASNRLVAALAAATRQAK